MAPDSVVTIRKGTDWHGRPVWRWRCNRCPRPKGRKPVGGDHRCSTFTSYRRGDKYPRAFDRCRMAALRHVHVWHNSAATWDDRLRDSLGVLRRFAS